MAHCALELLHGERRALGLPSLVDSKLQRHSGIEGIAADDVGETSAHELSLEPRGGKSVVDEICQPVEAAAARAARHLLVEEGREPVGAAVA